MAEDFLGISAHFDFGDLEEFIQHICEGLDRLGMNTADISKKLNEAFEKPDTSSLESSIESLKSKLSSLTEGTEEYKTTMDQLNQLQVQFDVTNLQAAAKGYTEIINVLNELGVSTEENAAKTQQLIDALTAMKEGLDGSDPAGQMELDSLSEQTSAAASELMKYGDQLQFVSQMGEQASDVLAGLNDMMSQVAAPEQPITPVNNGPVPEPTNSGTSDGGFASPSAEELLSIIDAIDLVKQKWDETLASFNDPGSSTSVNDLKDAWEAYSNTVASTSEPLKTAHQAAVDRVKQINQEMTRLELELKEVKASPATDDKLERISELKDRIFALYPELRKAREEEKALGEAIQQTNDEFKEAGDVIGEITDEMPSLSSAWGGVKDVLSESTDKFKNFMTGNGKAKEAIEKFKDGLDDLPGPLGGAVSGFKKMTSAAKMFISTPIGAILGVIVFLLKAFQTWLSKSAEGQRVMAQLTAFFSSLLESLTDILVKVGSYLFHAFVDAEGPMHDFATGLVTTLKHAVKSAVNMLKALGDTLAGIWTMFTDDWDQGWEQVKKGASEAVKSVEEGIEGVKSGFHTAVSFFEGAGKMAKDGWDNFSLDGLVSWGQNTLQTAKARAEAAKMELGLEEGITDNKRQQLDYDSRIAEKRDQIANATKETLAGTIKELKDITSAKYADLINQQEKRVALLKQENELHTATLKSLTAQKVAEVELYALYKKNEAAKRAIDNLEKKQEKKLDKAEKREADKKEKQEKKEKKDAENAAKRAQKKKEKEQRAAERQANKERKDAERQAKRNTKQQQAEDKAASELKETLRKNTDERVAEEIETQLKIDEARIDAMKDGVEKERALRNLEHKKALLEIDQQAQERISKEVARQKEEFERVQAIRKAQGKNYEDWDIDEHLDMGPINDILKEYEKIADYRQKSLENEDLKELTDKYTDYYEKRLKDAKRFNDEIERLIEARNKALENNEIREAESFDRLITRAKYERGKALVNDDIAEIKNDPENIEAFENLGRASTTTILDLIADFRRLAKEEEKAGRPIWAINEEIEKLQKQLLQDTPFVAMSVAADEARVAQKELDEAKRKLREVQEQMMPKLTFEKTGDNLWDWSYSAEMVVDEEAVAKAKEAVAKAQANYTKATQTAIAASTQAIGVIDKLRSSFEKLGKAIGGEVGNIMGFIGNIIGFAGSGLKEAMSNVDGYNKSSKALKDLTARHNAMKDMAKAAGKEIKETGLEGEIAGAKFEKAASKAQIWIAAMSAMVQIIGAVQNILPTADSLYEKYAQKQKEINNLRRAVEEYRLAVLLSQQAEKGWFAKSGLTSLTNAYEKHGKVVEAYFAKLYEAQEKYKNKSSGIGKALPYLAAAAAVVASAVVTIGTMGTGAAAVVGLLGAIGSSLGAAGTAVGAALIGTVVGATTAGAQAALAKIQYKNGQVAAKDNLRMKTRHKTWFRGEQTQDLVEWTRENLNAELFDEEGLINLEAAQTILDRYGDKLVGETKETLQDLVKLREQYNEFMKQVEEYVSNLYSPLVDNMTDALFDWLKNGTDVLYQFRQNAKGTFEAISKDMIKQMLMSSVFDKYSEDLKKIYAAYAMLGHNPNKNDFLITGVMAATDEFLSTAETAIPVLQEALTKINDQFAERGFDLTQSSDEGNAAYNASKSFSQEQGDELNGRLTALQIGQQQGIVQCSQLIELQSLTFGAVVQIGGALLTTSQDITAMRDMQYAGLQRLAEISVFTSVLPAMAENINDMRNDIRSKL